MHAARSSSKAFCPERLLAWGHRWPRLTAEIAAYRPHILALQARLR